MTVPSVDITKTDGNVGNTSAGVDGILAIIATCERGSFNVPAGYTRPDLALADYGYGDLTESFSYHVPVAKKGAVLVRANASTAAAYGTFSTTGGGTSVASAGASAPLDDFDALITFFTGGTIGTAGIEYTWSLDGGRTQSARLALGTANNIVIPNSGVTINFAAGTILANQTVAVTTRGPRMTNTDLVAALEALRLSDQPYEGVAVYSADADATMLSTLDLWLQARELEGKYRFGALNPVRRDVATQTPAQYATAMSTAFNASSSIRVAMGSDACLVASAIRGIDLRMPIIVPFCARAMAVDISESPAYVARGPLPGVTISDTRGNPLYHDEAKYPGLDDRRLVALRTIYGKQGVFVNQPLLLSPSGSDWVFLQHARVANKAAEMAYQLLTDELNKGVQTAKPRQDGKVFILEEDAAAIEQRIDTKLQQEFFDKKRVTGISFVLSRTDDLSGTGPVTVSSTLDISPLRYIGRIRSNLRLVRQITASAQN